MSCNSCKAQRAGNTPYLKKRRYFRIRARTLNSVQGGIFLRGVQSSIILQALTAVGAANFGGSVGMGTVPLINHTCTE